MGEHISVLLDETIEILNVKKDGIYLDLTLGRGGHSLEVLRRLTTGHLYSFDLDLEALKESEPRLKEVSDNFTLIHSNFANCEEEMESRGIKEVDGIMMDLGVSSPQFDEGERGFSYKEDAELDMRMDETASLTAERIVNTYSEEDLKNIFYSYGEDPDSKRIAHNIVLEREQKPIKTTTELVNIIKASKPKWRLEQKGHPAKQIFQALRIETNGELDNLKKALDTTPYMLKKGGILAIISFQSLEDRLVKDKFLGLSRIEGTRYGPQSIKTDESTEFMNLTRHPIIPSKEELAINHRSHSAKLRAIERKEE